QPLILIYHRVAAVPVDPWGLAVSPKHFAEHLDVLRRTRHPMPLATFVSRIAERTLPRNAVAITFDDGYADNLLAAKPGLDAADGLVAIGAHSVTHSALASLVPAARHREIAESKAACEALIGAPITAFAYPYGDLDSEVRSAVESAGFVYACTTEPAPVAAGC